MDFKSKIDKVILLSFCNKLCVNKIPWGWLHVGTFYPDSYIGLYACHAAHLVHRIFVTEIMFVQKRKRQRASAGTR